MGVGGGIALIVIGAILAFALNIPVGGFVNLSLIGYILIAAGVVVFIIGLVSISRRRQTSTVTRTEVDPASGQRTTRSTTESTNDTL
ncbi:MAG: hypothetical protein CMH36_07325 [Microbacterium sp.]|jgi:hypothetical protein|uniref:IncA protein n=1 Tax=Microbacterium ginsengisoli TaxID=400772 RepID=A0A0F0M3L7_9MICO|nr:MULTISPECIES: DUF6458 family protein [Microbacterium]MAL06621.1 hypothetical protein [Microbacterium sp.]KJL44190.1 IncA protein [Microbacterium ginsengisoli]MBN9209385.1 hypothetical protein [Microbacterium ginsengisoli]ODU75839.1 MAG: hypothetical protein ABT08_10040 [Microbacterium sp. SCN 71-21]HAN25665.1 hypothetical protein [Microbacterium ginsengisoli]